jgi:hypothetical protein
MLPNNDLHLVCLQWGEWHRTRRLYAPLPPKNILAKMRVPSAKANPDDLPDAALEPHMVLFNRAVNGLAGGPEKTAFLAYYIHKVRIRDLMDAYDRSQRTIFSRIEATRERAFLVYLELAAGRYSDVVDTSLDERRKLRRASAHTYANRYDEEGRTVARGATTARG